MQWLSGVLTETHTSLTLLASSHRERSYLGIFNCLFFWNFAFIFSLFAFRQPPMASNHLASSEHISKPKRKEHKFLTIAEKMEILRMKKEEKSSSAIARHFGVSISTINKMKKAEDRIRRTADSTFNMSTNKLISPCYKPLFLMETALLTWIANCWQKNMALNKKIIQTKAMSLYKTFSSKEIDGSQDCDENKINDSQSANSSASKYGKRFSASNDWFYRFRKRYGLESVILPGNAASNSTIATKSNTKRNNDSDREYAPEPVSDTDESGISTR